MGIDLGRRRLSDLLCVLATLLEACGGTSQRSGPFEPAQPGSGGSSASSPAAGGGGVQGNSDSCPKLQPRTGSACTPGERCFYPGSSSPCAPPDATYTCTAGGWNVQYRVQNGSVCVQEACPGVNPATGCPQSTPVQGSSCLQCSASASCQYGELAAQCEAGLWQVAGSGNAGAGGAGDAAGGAGGAR